MTVGTRDIQNVTVTTKPSLPGQITIKGDFVDEFTANGVFVIIYYSLTDYSDLHYIAKQAEDTIDLNIMNLPGTECNVSVFSLENGEPFERAVTSTNRVTMGAVNCSGHGQICTHTVGSGFYVKKQRLRYVYSSSGPEGHST